MKFVHLSDLHLGKRVNEFPMLEDQEFILEKITGLIRAEAPDAVLIAGDIYDRPVPSAESVELFDRFLVELSALGVQVFVISGNHDSPERIAFGRRLMEGSGVHMSPVYHGSLEPVDLEDDYGKVHIYMLPFIKPAHVRRYFPEAEIGSYTDAIRAVLENARIRTEERNVLITHQFVTGAERSESEEISVGGSDNVDASVFDAFDYVALGHIHRPQNCGSVRIRYCGTPLKYSFSEAKDEKSVTIAELKEKGSLTVRTEALTPLHEMREIRGKYEELMERSFYRGTDYLQAYMHITLTDEEDIPDVVNRLRTVYQNLMKVDYDNLRTRNSAVIEGADDIERKSPMELFGEFYELQNNQPLNEEQREFMERLIGEIWEVGL